jgi:predicted Zn finger-like uncharacterized protein
VLLRCARCHAVYSVQDGLTGPVQRTFAVECGRCHAVFDAHSSLVGETRMPGSRRLATPPFLEKAASSPVSAAVAKPRRANGDESSDAGALRPVIYGPVAKRRPLASGGAVALVAVAVVALASWLVLNHGGLRRSDATKAGQARAALLLDDDASLEHAASLFAEAARVAAGDVALEADRAFALLLRGSAKRDLADRREAAARSDPSVAAERETNWRDGAQLVQEGAALARTAVDRAGDDAAALRAMALAAALTSGNPHQWLEKAGRKGGDDPLLAYVRAAAELAGGRDGSAQDRAAAALAAARRIEPRLLRAQVDAAALALDRHDLAAARQGLQAVLEANPKHERAKVLLSLVSP